MPAAGSGLITETAPRARRPPHGVESHDHLQVVQGVQLSAELSAETHRVLVLV